MPSAVPPPHMVRYAFRAGQTADVDFLRERDRTESKLFHIVRVAMIHPYWDMALLVVDGLADVKPLQLSVELRREGGRLVHLSGGLADEDPVPDDEPDLPLALDGLLDSLTPGQLEEHPLRARRLGVAPARVVEREVLDDHEVGHVDVREAADERLDGGPGVLRHARRGADAEGREEQQEDGGAGHVIWL